MILNSKFDVLRGWSRDASVQESFPARKVAGVAVVLPAGTVVRRQPDGSVDKATSPNLSAADPIAPWIVVEGNDDFSGRFVGKIVCIRAGLEVRLDPANFVPGTYNVDTLVSFDGGRFKVAAANEQVIGEVVASDIATDGTLVVYYHGGAIRKA